MNAHPIWDNRGVTTDTQAPEQTEYTATADDKRMLMVVTLKSGVQIRMDVSEYTVKRNYFGALTGIEWQCTEDTGAMIQHLELDEVAAVHTEWP